MRPITRRARTGFQVRRSRWAAVLGVGALVVAGGGAVRQPRPGTGALQTVTVQDFRGGPAGWSLTGEVTDFKGPGGARTGADALGWTPACATKAGSPSTCAAGSGGTVGSAGATLASTPDGAFTGGEFTVDAQLALDVPAYTAAGAYSGVLTLTLT